MSQTMIGAQMFTVREHTKTVADLAETCKKLKAMGYDAVQASAIGAEATPEELGKIFKDAGLEVAATHVGLDLMKDTQKCLDYHAALDCKYTAVGGFGWGDPSAKDWSDFVAEYGQIAKTLGAKGLMVGYHNHSHEWALVEGKRPIDILVDEASKDIWFELDMYWVAHAGADPAAWVNRIAASGRMVSGETRIPCVHFKDMQINKDRTQKMAEVGDGNLNWPAILEACKKAEVKWYLVERDSGDLDPFDSLKISIENMKGWGLS